MLSFCGKKDMVGVYNWLIHIFENKVYPLCSLSEAYTLYILRGGRVCIMVTNNKFPTLNGATQWIIETGRCQSSTACTCPLCPRNSLINSIPVGGPRRWRVFFYFLLTLFSHCAHSAGLFFYMYVRC